jgi:hypothetical protein
MIDPELLRTLGWSEQLIVETLNAAQDLIPRFPSIEPARGASPATVSGASNQLFADTPRVSTSHQLTVGIRHTR